MRVFEGCQNADDDANGLVGLNRALADDVLEQSTVDVFHHDERDLRFVAADLGDRLLARVEDAHDGGVSHTGGRLRLLAEAGAECRVGGKR